MSNHFVYDYTLEMTEMEGVGSKGEILWFKKVIIMENK